MMMMMMMMMTIMMINVQRIEFGSTELPLLVHELHLHVSSMINAVIVLLKN
jgi:hypothetical protein